MNSIPDNPYAAPKVDSADLLESSHLSNLRHTHLKHETAIRVIGVFYYLLSSTILLAVLSPVFQDAFFFTPLGTIGLILVASFFGMLGFGISNLKKWVHTTAVNSSMIGLILVPIGTFPGICILYFLLGNKGQTIFSQEYHEAIAVTPHLKYHVPTLTNGLIIILLFLAGGFIFLHYFGNWAP